MRLTVITINSVVVLILLASFGFWVKYEINQQGEYMQKQMYELSTENTKLKYTVDSLVRLGLQQDVELRSNKTKLLFLATMMNENTAAIQAGKFGDTILINSDWTINSMPRYIDMGTQEMEWILKFINKEEALKRTPPLPTPQVIK